MLTSDLQNCETTNPCGSKLAGSRPFVTAAPGPGTAWTPDLGAGYLLCARPEDGTFCPALTPKPSLWKARPGRGVLQTSTAVPHPPAQNALACIYKHLLPVLLPQDAHTRCCITVAESKHIPATGAARGLPIRFPLQEAFRHRAGHLATVKKANFPAALPSRVAPGGTKASEWPSAEGTPPSPSFLRLAVCPARCLPGPGATTETPRAWHSACPTSTGLPTARFFWDYEKPFRTKGSLGNKHTCFPKPRASAKKAECWRMRFPRKGNTAHAHTHTLTHTTNTDLSRPRSGKARKNWDQCLSGMRNEIGPGNSVRGTHTHIHTRGFLGPSCSHLLSPM